MFVLRTRYEVVLFDLVGVITPTAEIHERIQERARSGLSARRDPTPADVRADTFGDES
jgi:beta-phosphoglucomutase-like phosphatase (HAD superfamily)